MSEDKTKTAQRKAYIDVFVANPNMRDPMGHVDTALKLPVFAVEFAEALKHIGVTDLSGKDYYFHSMGIWDYRLMKHFPRPDLDNFEELNYLAAKIHGLGEHGLDIFTAVMETGKYCDGNIKDIINIVENVNCFDLLPFHNEMEYGNFLVEFGLDDHADALASLDESEHDEDRALVEYIEFMQAHLNPETFGRDAVAKENGVFTQNGYLTGGEGFQEVYRGVMDIPKKYRVLDGTELPVRVENADLTDLVFKMHALGGECSSQEGYHIRMLARGDKADYLLMMISNAIFLDDAGSCYQSQEEGCQNWLNNTAETKRAFALHVRNRSEDNHVFGDIIEVDFNEIRRDIQEHAIHCGRVESVLEDGTEQSFSEAEWEALGDEQRQAFDSWTMVYNPDEIRALNAYLREQRQERANVGRLLEPDEFLRYLNIDFMKSAENPQPDMFRIAQNAATKILARSDAPVFRLLPGDPKQLNPLDALKKNGELWFATHREFAVKMEDWAGIDKWAKRGIIAALKHMPERGAPEKSKNNGPEH